MSGDKPIDKKAQVQQRNKRHGIINLMSWVHEAVAAEKQLSAPETDWAALKEEEDRKRKEEAVIWTEKTQSVRNRLTGRRSMAKDRWNRFAGTSGGGGRGR